VILRKPYALLIKNFKLIHVIFSVIALFLFLRTSDLLSFIDEYIVNSGFIVEDYQISELLPGYINLLIVFIVLLNVVIGVLLKYKGKRITFYIINIVIYLVIFVGYAYTSSLINTMQTQIVDTRVVRALRDIFNILSVVQIISLVMYAFRATGFDVKKFNFTKDLIDLEIAETDNEEVEVAVDIDINKINRARRKNIRMLKYFYFENKFWCNIAIAAVSFIFVCIIVVSSFNKAKTYKQHQVVSVTNYNFQIEDVYITNKDKNNKIIEEDKSFVILEVKAKKKNNKDQQLNTTRFELKTKNTTYYHKNIYKDYFVDFGTIYTNQELDSEFENYFLVYRISNEDLNGKIYLNYVDTREEIVVNFNTINLLNDKTETITLGESKSFENSVLNDYVFTLNKFELAEKIKVNYKYCIKNDNCINAIEYVVPKISTNYEKAVLRLDGTLQVPEEYNTYAVNMEMLLTKFGYLRYVIDGKTYTSNFLGTLSASKVKQDNTAYFEVKEEVLNASDVTLVLRLRNHIYELKLKEGA